MEDAVNHVEGELTRMAEKIDAAEDEIDKSMTDMKKRKLLMMLLMTKTMSRTNQNIRVLRMKNNSNGANKHPSSTDEEHPACLRRRRPSAYV